MRKLIAIVVALMVLLTLALVPIAPAAAQGVLHTVSGGGTNTWTVTPPVSTGLPPFTTVRTMSFYAEQTSEDGHATGSLHFYDRIARDGQPLTIDVHVMFLVVDGDEAWISGRITSSNRITDGWVVGDPLIVRVLDSGKGKPADMSSLVITGTFDPSIALSMPKADVYWGFDLHEWTHGNFQIQ